MIESERDGILWADAFRDLPAPARRKLLDYIVAQSREIAALSAEIERLRPAPTRADRLAGRDAAIRAALAAYDGPPTIREKALADDLSRAATLKCAPLSARLQAAAEILRLNGGQTITWRQLDKIANGYRR